MQPDPAVEEPIAVSPAEVGPADVAPQELAPAAPPVTPAPTAPRRRLVVWLAVAAALVLIVGGGAFFLLRPATPPASIEALRDLLVNPTDRESTVTMFPHDPSGTGTANSPVNGGRWAVQREWSESAERTGYVLLLQFDTPAQAHASLAYYRNGASQDGAREQPVPDRSDAYLYTLPVTGDAKTSSIGLGQQGTVVAILGSGTEPPDYVQSLLVKQLDLLP